MLLLEQGYTLLSFSLGRIEVAETGEPASLYTVIVAFPVPWWEKTYKTASG